MSWQKCCVLLLLSLFNIVNNIHRQFMVNSVIHVIKNKYISIPGKVDMHWLTLCGRSLIILIARLNGFFCYHCSCAHISNFRKCNFFGRFDKYSHFDWNWIRFLKLSLVITHNLFAFAGQILLVIHHNVTQ